MRVPTKVGFPLRTIGRVSIIDVRSTPASDSFQPVHSLEIDLEEPLFKTNGTPGLR